MKINAQFITRCILALEKALESLENATPTSTEYDMYRAAVIKEFEIILEQSGKLLRKRLRPFFHSNKAVDKLPFKNLFRQAGKHGLLEIEEVTRWLHYRDNRNSTTHDYGHGLAENTLPIIPQFIKDAKRIVSILEENYDN